MESRCETCPMRDKAEKNPKALLSRIWKWHTSWCPGWKAYQKILTKKEEAYFASEGRTEENAKTQ